MLMPSLVGSVESGEGLDLGSVEEDKADGSQCTLDGEDSMLTELWLYMQKPESVIRI